MDDKIITAVDEITNSDVIEEAESIGYTSFAKNDSDILDRHRLRKAQHEIRRLELNISNLTAYVNQRDDDNEALIRALSRTYAASEENLERAKHFQEQDNHKSDLLWTIKKKCKPVAEGEEEPEVVKFAKEILYIAEGVL